MTTPTKFNEAWIAPAWKKLTEEVAYKTYSLNLPLAAADIASRAINYALRPGMEGTGMFPSSEKHLFCIAKKIAKWCICKEIKKAKRAIVSYTLDIPEEGKDGERHDNTKAESNYLGRLFRAEECHKDMMELGRLALSRLDGFLARKGVSKRDIRIFKDRVLLEMQCDDVCRKYSIKPSNLYKIVCVVNGILATKGRALVRE